MLTCLEPNHWDLLWGPVATHAKPKGSKETEVEKQTIFYKIYHKPTRKQNSIRRQVKAGLPCPFKYVPGKGGGGSLFHTFSKMIFFIVLEKTGWHKTWVLVTLTFALERRFNVSYHVKWSFPHWWNPISVQRARFGNLFNLADTSNSPQTKHLTGSCEITGTQRCIKPNRQFVCEWVVSVNPFDPTPQLFAFKAQWFYINTLLK